HQDQLPVVIAVQHFDVDPGVGHEPGELSELPGNRLTQPLHDDVADAKYADTGRLQRVPRAFAVGEQEMGRAIVADDPGAAAFDADAGPRQCFAHVCQGT